MKKEEVKKLVEYFEDRIINNFDVYFNYLILEDFYEGGFEDRISDDFFYAEYFSQYYESIIKLLLEIEENYSNDFENLKLRLIKLKRVIDTKLNCAKSTLNDDLKQSRMKRKKMFLIDSKLDKNIFIKTLYQLLIDSKLVDLDFGKFSSHFENNWETKIQWFGTELQLVHLISLLIENNFLEGETMNFKNKLISSHFINKKGNAFKVKQLSSVYADKREMIAVDDVIYKIIEQIRDEL